MPVLIPTANGEDLSELVRLRKLEIPLLLLIFAAVPPVANLGIGFTFNDFLFQSTVTSSVLLEFGFLFAGASPVIILETFDDKLVERVVTCLADILPPTAFGLYAFNISAFAEPMSPANIDAYAAAAPTVAVFTEVPTSCKPLNSIGN